MEFFSAALFALAVSMDGFGVGLAYGFRRITLPWLSTLIICLNSTVAITCSMLFGQTLAAWLPPFIAEKVGAAILIVIGSWLFVQSLLKKRSKDEKEVKKQERLLFKARLPGLGIAVQVLREPSKADFDRSGNINSREACVLGFALAMDALGAGFGLAIAGFNIWYIPLMVGSFQVFLLHCGLWSSKWGGEKALMRKGTVIPGVVLVVLGLLKI